DVEHLTATIAAIGHVNQAILRYLDGMYGVPESRRSVARGSGRGGRRRWGATRRGWSGTARGRAGRRGWIFVWRLAKGAPHALEGARVCVEDNYATVAVAVGHEDLVGLLVNVNIGGPLDVLGIFVPARLIPAAD